MFALGLMGSPRKKGNTAYLLSTVMEALAQKGARTQSIYVPGKDIKPCIGCTHCEKHGYCVQKDDDMVGEMFGLLRQADIIVAATPIYFYNATAQLKLLIDRTQTLWSRKYKLGLDDPRESSRTGLMLAVGATRGKNLFEGMNLTAKYFFDAVRADFVGALGYRRIEDPGDMARYEGLNADVDAEVAKLDALFARKKVLFLSREGAFRGPMAAAFAMRLASDRLEVKSAGITASATMDSLVPPLMAEKGLDMAFQAPRPLESVLAEIHPDVIVAVDGAVPVPNVAGAEIYHWDMPPATEKTLEAGRAIRNDVEARVHDLTDKI
ncbi:MAG: NAD(P)H-dependent oxidoreductase [Thermodesulfobacteriota bacterium]|nr:NAD(P)H-dependent oxidoreductase [Thermodesulfobacteriota bacterium]